MTRKATIEDIDILVPLFDAYRQFYRQAPDTKGAHDFLRQRLAAGESVIFLAFDETQPAGFTQLYPSFSSVRMGRLWILNDLFVHPDHRRKHTGHALIRTAQDFVRNDRALGMLLQTDMTNHAAQQLYENTGWQRENDSYYYRWDV